MGTTSNKTRVKGAVLVKEVVRISAHSEVVIRGFVDIQGNKEWLFKPAEFLDIRVARALVKMHEGKILVNMKTMTSVKC